MQPLTDKKMHDADVTLLRNNVDKSFKCQGENVSPACLRVSESFVGASLLHIGLHGMWGGNSCLACQDM